MNFICGVLAVMASVNGGDGFRIAMLLILLGIVFDGLDGPIARRFGSSHRFGIWLDSIADAMTFCVAPAILVYNMFKMEDGSIYSLQNIIVLVASLSIALLGILRLARFSLSQHKWKDFIGLPTPAFAMTVVALTSLYFWSLELDFEANGFTTGDPLLVPVILFFLSWSMVSDVLYRKYRGTLLMMGSFFLLLMILSLIFGTQEPSIGMMGSIMFTAASAGYVISPIGRGPRKIWGARRRLELEYEEDLLEEMDMEDDDIEIY
jgi:CDP-diacylglycerol--serine O-phosphatidyltransferase